VKALAALLLCSCAHVQMAIPASLPMVRVDPTLSGAVISREAAVALLSKRETERAEAAKKTVDLMAKAKVLEANLETETKRANEHSWWSVYGAPLVVCDFVVGVSIGAVIAVLIDRRLR